MLIMLLSLIDATQSPNVGDAAISQDSNNSVAMISVNSLIFSAIAIFSTLGVFVFSYFLLKLPSKSASDNLESDKKSTDSLDLKDDGDNGEKLKDHDQSDLLLDDSDCEFEKLNLSDLQRGADVESLFDITPPWDGLTKEEDASLLTAKITPTGSRIPMSLMPRAPRTTNRLSVEHGENRDKSASPVPDPSFPTHSDDNSENLIDKSPRQSRASNQTRIPKPRGPSKSPNRINLMINGYHHNLYRAQNGNSLVRIPTEKEYPGAEQKRTLSPSPSQLRRSPLAGGDGTFTYEGIMRRSLSHNTSQNEALEAEMRKFRQAQT